MLFTPFIMAAQFFNTASNFPNFDVSNAFSQIQWAPGPDLYFGMVGKSLNLDADLEESCVSVVACPPSVKMKMSLKEVKSIKSKMYYTIMLVCSSVSFIPNTYTVRSR